AKKSTARRATAKKSTARRATAKKSTARRATAKKSTARRATAKKSTARRATAKKSTGKRATAKKSTGKRATAKKSTGKRATALRRAPAQAPSAANKATIRQIERAWNTSDVDALDEHFAPGYHNHAGMPGMAADLGTAKMAHAMAMRAFPDRKVEILDILAEDDRVLVRTRVTGTNSGGAFWFGASAN